MPASRDDDLTAAARERVGRSLRQKWRLDALLGIGGMAAVYAATHRNGNRAAVKVLHDELSAVEAVRTRFLREAYVANKVAHPGAVRVVDDDTDADGTTFLVMDLLDGETLAQRLERGPRIAPVDVCRIADAVLDVLAAAHDKGIVHRDVKPENVFLTTSGGAMLLDFGFARVMDAAQQSSALTGVRTTIGTPAFMPPEQASGRWADVDGRSDLWALGATMFFASCGEHVHEGASLADVLVAAATKPARSLRIVAPRLPAGVIAVVERALAFDKPMRWASARAMREALRQAMKSADAGSEPPPSSDGDATLVVDEMPTFVLDGKEEKDAPTLRPPPRPPRSDSTLRSAPRSDSTLRSAPRSDSTLRSAPRPPPASSVDVPIDDDSVSATMLATRLDTYGAPLAGMARVSDPGAAPESIPGSAAGRVIVATAPYGGPFWEQSPASAKRAPSGAAPLPPGMAPLPPPRSQQATVPAFGREVARRNAMGPMLIVAGAAGFLVILLLGVIAFLVLR